MAKIIARDFALLALLLLFGALAPGAEAQVLPRLDCIEPYGGPLAEDVPAGATQIRLVPVNGTHCAAPIPTAGRVFTFIINPGGANQEQFEAFGHLALGNIHCPDFRIDTPPLAFAHRAGERVISPSRIIAHFGYFNTTPNQLTFAAGSVVNQFTPLPANRFQPSVFLPGLHSKVVSVDLSAGELSWFINGQAIVARDLPEFRCTSCNSSNASAPDILSRTLSLEAGSVTANIPVATVSSATAAVADLTVSLSSITTPAGASTTDVSMTGLTNNNGLVSATASVNCAPTQTRYFASLRVADPSGNFRDATLIINVTPNSGPTLSYNSPYSVQAGGSINISPANGPFNAQSVSLLAINPPGLGSVSVSNSGVVSVTGAGPAGDYTITIRATGPCNATADASFTLKVTGDTPAPAPTISCPSNIVTGADAGQCSALVAFNPSAQGSPTPSVECKVGSTVITSPHRFPIGTTSVTCTATNAGGAASCSFTVTVRDNERPAITGLANISTSAASGRCSAVVSYNPSATDNCSLASITCSPPSGSVFPVGTTTVTCTATDSAGNSSSAAFTVTVADNQPPVISCPADLMKATARIGDTSVAVSFQLPAASDNCSDVTVSCNPSPGSTFPVGATVVNCTASDRAGNVSSCSFTVSVFDVFLKDDGDSGKTLMFNSVTGDYVFQCGSMTLTGRGSVVIKGGEITLTHNAADRRVLGRVLAATRIGTASLQSPPGTSACTILDRDITNNT
ncbi:MAG TPA: HYR domain-containing protein [Blastocatellia bacterium]|nr:HYR domain-containing protein [Blastocatellia bacterium]